MILQLRFKITTERVGFAVQPFDGTYGVDLDFNELGEGPLTIGVSACLSGHLCNYRGQDNPFELVQELMRLSAAHGVRWEPFCPEQVTMGTPREPMNIVGGDGADVLAGRAKVLTHGGSDVTDHMIRGAEGFVQVCRSKRINLVLLMEGSPSCGSHWIYDGELWPKKMKRRGVGVATAMLLSHGISVVSPLDEKALFRLRQHILGPRK